MGWLAPVAVVFLVLNVGAPGCRVRPFDSDRDRPRDFPNPADRQIDRDDLTDEERERLPP